MPAGCQQRPGRRGGTGRTRDRQDGLGGTDSGRQRQHREELAVFINVHAHAYREPPPVYGLGTAEQVLERHDAVGIEMVASLPVVSPEICMPQANEDILEMAERYPDRWIPICSIDPRAMTNSADAPLDRLLRHYRDLGCKGLGEVMPNLPGMEPRVQNLFHHAQEVGLPVTFDGSVQLWRFRTLTIPDCRNWSTHCSGSPS